MRGHFFACRGTGPTRNKLISTLAGAAFSFAASGLAFAADMAVKIGSRPCWCADKRWTSAIRHWWLGLDITAAPAVGGPTFGPGTRAFSQSKTNIGFVAGGGLEGRFSAWLPPNGTWKSEYLYLGLGSLNSSTSFAAAPFCGLKFFLSS